MGRAEAWKEKIIDSENAYISRLDRFLWLRTYIKNPALRVPPILRSREDIIFGNGEDILRFHQHIFLPQLEKCREKEPVELAEVFLDWDEVSIHE